jgi:hypothetical protein
MMRHPASVCRSTSVVIQWIEPWLPWLSNRKLRSALIVERPQGDETVEAALREWIEVRNVERGDLKVPRSR